MMQRYREKTKIIEAVQFNPDDLPWLECVKMQISEVTTPGDAKHYYIDTIGSGRDILQAGDWIVKGVSGTRHVCPDKVFSSLYELIEVPLD